LSELAQEDGTVFRPILNIPDTRCGFSEDELGANVAKRFEAGYPRLHSMEGYGKYKGTNPLAIVTGGPSLNKTHWRLNEYKTIMVCGSAHDHLVNMGYKPDYAVICDADPSVPENYRRPVKTCKYLLASSCHDSIFEALAGHDVTIFHNAGIDPKHYRGEPYIQGGCTVTLRALNVAIVLGYLDHHYFGFDSSFEDFEHHHAYSYGSDEDVIRVRVGGEGGRVFLTTPTWLCQALHFQEQLRKTGHLFSPTVHGDGMIAEIMRCAKPNQH
jgi:hypothetical protein